MQKVSVVMTTYNGSKYILEQMESIKKQTRRPDEVIIFDDNSGDDTAEIVKEYIIDNKLDNWTLHINDFNLGWKRNFIEAIKCSTGELVFLSDQDDVWASTKIEKMVSCFAMNPSIQLLVSDSTIIYSDTCAKRKKRKFYSFKDKAFCLDSIWNNDGIISKINRTMKGKHTHDNSIHKIPFNEKIFSSQKQGCVMAFQRNLFEEILPYWRKECPHDTLLWFAAASKDALYYLDSPLIYYRHHTNNTGFADTLGNRLTASSEIKKISNNIVEIKNLAKLLDDGKINDAQKKKLMVKNILMYQKLRIRFLSKKKLSDGILVSKKIHTYGKRQVLFDWLLAYLT